MDKRGHDILDRALEAARAESGISEHELREIFERRLRSGPSAAPTFVPRSFLILTLSLLLLATLAWLVVSSLGEDSPGPGSSPTATRQQAAVPNRTAPPMPESPSVTDRDTAHPTESASPVGAAQEPNRATAPRPRPTPRSTKPPATTIPSPAASIDSLRADLGRISSRYWRERFTYYSRVCEPVLDSSELAMLPSLRARFAIAVAHIDRMLAGGDTAIGVWRNRMLTTYQRVFNISMAHVRALDSAKGDFYGDLARYFRTLHSRTLEFGNTHANVPDVRRFTDTVGPMLAQSDSQTVAMKEPAMAKQGMMFKGYVVCPMTLLYDGYDLHTQLVQLRISLDAMQMPIDLSEGFAIDVRPDQKLRWRANASTATIGFDLTESSRSTLMELYDSTGAVILRRDLGARPRGELAEAVDIGSIPSGIYLCRLMIRTSNDEERYARTVEISR